MDTERVNNLKAFRDFADTKLSNGGPDLTLGEALDLWDVENQSDQEKEETLQAIREGLSDMYAGRTRDAREVLSELREKHKLGQS